MKKVLVFVSTLVASISVCNAQSDYSISYYQDAYDEFPTEVLGFPQYIESEFGFNFPFFDTSFISLKINIDGFGEFGNGLDDNEFYFFSSDYWSISIDNPWGKSDYVVEGVKALIFQWKNIVLKPDHFLGFNSNHYLNFQVWFFESGDIEIHFGNCYLDESPYWVDSLGMIDENSYLVGPGIGIVSPGKEKHLFIGGFLDNLQIYDNKYEAEPLRELPPEGFVIKFHRLLPVEENELGKLNVYPNPGTGVFYFDLPAGIQAESIQVYNLAGDLVHKSLDPQNNTINLERLPDGIYTVIMESKTQKVFRKVVKISN